MVPKNRKLSQTNLSNLSTGLHLSAVNVSSSDQKFIEVATTHYKSICKNGATRGKGLIVFEGLENQDGSIFIGKSSKFDGHTIRFLGPNTLQNVEDFRAQVLTPTNKIDFSKVSFSSISGELLVIPPTAFSSPLNFQQALADVLANQTKNIPKVSISGSTLQVGSTSSSNIMKLEAVVAGANVAYFALNFRFKDQTAGNVFQTLSENGQLDLITAVAYQLATNLGNMALTTLLEVFRADLLKNYQVGTIYAQRGAVSKNYSKSGSYVQKSLTGVFNKLIQESSSIEAQKIVERWLNDIVLYQNTIKNGEDFVKTLKASFGSKQPVIAKTKLPPKKDIKSARRTTASKSVSFAPTDQPIGQIESTNPETPSENEGTTS